MVSQNEAASEVGRQILLDGGNAVDAAVAMGFALAVTLPRAGNLGGSGFMLVHMSESAGSEAVTALDFRSVAPAAASSDAFRGEDGDILWDDLTFGPRAAGVPGTVAGLEEAWRRFGMLSWQKVIAPAVEMAEEGIEISNDLAYALSEALAVMRRYPSSMEAYAREDGSAYAARETLVQPDLAWSLRQIRDHGAEAFLPRRHRGENRGLHGTGRRLDRCRDLAAYSVSVRDPVATDYRGYRVVTMPPSSVGGLCPVTDAQCARYHYDMARLAQGSAASLHVLAETMKLGTPTGARASAISTSSKCRLRAFSSESIAREMAASIDPDRARRWRKSRPSTPIPTKAGTPRIFPWWTAKAMRYP